MKKRAILTANIAFVAIILAAAFLATYLLMPDIFISDRSAEVYAEHVCWNGKE